MKDPNKVKRGKASRAAGNRFELKVRHDLESKGWIVCKWQNNIENDKLIPAKHKFNFFTKAMSAGNGFPDFLCLKNIMSDRGREWQVQLVESKMAGVLDKVEKQKIAWIKENLKIPVIVAKKGERRGDIVYEEQ